ncbi:hypothetical protein MHYP_G00260560 [Metynnis hypsauchen]
MSSSPDSPSTSTDPLNNRRSCQWPSPFLIPTFSYDVELPLKKGNEKYNTKKIPLDVTRDMENDILDKIAQAVFSITSYPAKHQICNEFERITTVSLKSQFLGALDMYAPKLL